MMMMLTGFAGLQPKYPAIITGAFATGAVQAETRSGVNPVKAPWLHEAMRQFLPDLFHAFNTEQEVLPLAVSESLAKVKSILSTMPQTVQQRFQHSIKATDALEQLLQVLLANNLPDLAMLAKASQLSIFVRFNTYSEWEFRYGAAKIQALAKQVYKPDTNFQQVVFNTDKFDSVSMPAPPQQLLPGLLSNNVEHPITTALRQNTIANYRPIAQLNVPPMVTQSGVMQYVQLAYNPSAVLSVAQYILNPTAVPPQMIVVKMASNTMVSALPKQRTLCGFTLLELERFSKILAQAKSLNRGICTDDTFVDTYIARRDGWGMQQQKSCLV